MKLVYSIMLFLAISFSAFAEESTAVFNWSDPTSLNPSYKAPTADNRYGEYISKVTFTANGATFCINDDSVKELSQKARFLYGYNTKIVEMRAYPTSIITVSAPDGGVIKSVTFEGAKVTSDYISAVDDDLGTFSGSEWKASESVAVTSIDLYIDATINCTKTTVKYVGNASVGAISNGKDVYPVRWYDLTGRIYTSKPASRGLYIVKNNDGSTRRVIVK